MLGTATPHRGARCLPFTGGSALTSLPINQMLEGRSAPRGPSAPRKDRGHRVISSPRMSPPAPGNRGLRHRAQNGAAESPLWWVSRWPVACETRVYICAHARVCPCLRVCMCARAFARVRMRVRARPPRTRSLRFGAERWCLSLPGCTGPPPHADRREAGRPGPGAALPLRQTPRAPLRRPDPRQPAWCSTRAMTFSQKRLVTV